MCQQIVTHIVQGGRLDIMLKVNIHSNWTDINDTNAEAQLGQKVAEVLEDSIGLHLCGSCSVSVYTDRSSYSGRSSEVNVYFEKRFTPSCQLEFIYETILKVSGKQLEILRTTFVHITAIATIAEKADYERYNYYRPEQLFSRNDNYCSSKLKVVIRITEPLCPRIQIAFSESGKLKQKNRKQSFHAFFENLDQINDNTTVHVCVADYVKVMRIASRSAKTHVVGYVRSFVMFLYMFTL